MDFDMAVNKLSRNHSRQVRRNRGKNTVGSSSRNKILLSERAKKEAEESKRQYEESKRLEKIKKEKLRHVHSYVSKCERELGTVKIVSSGTSNDDDMCFQPTSIHGDGDKITLPVSVLKLLMELDELNNSNNNTRNSPFEFRVGVLNPDYKFPASPAMIQKMEQARVEDDDIDSDSDEEEDDATPNTAFLEELSHRYLSYTHCTVVEFTQEEGHVGLPKAIAKALLDRNASIPVTRTVDPASMSIKEDALMKDEDEEETAILSAPTEDKTPGHLAWGEFDVPEFKVEVSMVTLPKGKGCTLTPTLESARQGFHNLQDVKSVLEQSLIRTRATLSLNDTVHCWHRGTKFDMTVSSVTPNHFAAVSCINTDIEVDIGPVQDGRPANTSSDTNTTTDTVPPPPTAVTTGRTLGSSSTTPTTTTLRPQNNNDIPLPLEPPPEQKSGVCTVQIRGDGKTGRRRFDIHTAKESHLFSFAAQVCGGSSIPPFRLVTRFPRKVLTGDSSSDSLKDVGIEEGQEMFMMEFI